MEIIVSAIAVVVAAGCFMAVVASDMHEQARDKQQQTSRVRSGNMPDKRSH